MTRDLSVPGRASRSAALDAPSTPLISGILMRKGAGGSLVDGASADVDRAAASSGRALPDDLRSRFEGSLGTDLSAVRVHDGADSQTAASSVAAKAYTVGNDIHFGAGQYDPGSQDGQHLIAHEVAHTVQQRGGTPMRQNKLAVSHAGDSFEVEADRAADAMVSGAPVSIGGASIGLARTPQEQNDDPKEAQEKSDVISGAKSAATGKDGTRTFRTDSTGFSLGGKSTRLSYGPNGLTGALKIGGKDWGVGTKLDKSVAVPITPGTGVFFKVNGGVGISTDVSVSVTGAAPTGDTLTATVTGTGSVSLSATGRVTAGGYVGAPIANLNVGGYLELAASGEASVSISGKVQIKDNGAGAPKVTGTATLTVNPEAKVVGSGGITVGYNAVVTDGKLYEHQMGSLPIAEASMPIVGTYDFATQKGSFAKPVPVVKYLPLSLPPATARLGKDSEKFAAGVIKREKQRQANAAANEKSHRMDHGVNDEAQQTENVPEHLQPSECTEPGSLDVAKEPERQERGKYKTWVSENS
ncbi:MAG: DUF4157 domain-containing protein [Deltaproteobacteria bacterium]|nr:DUF4157 domain-containing protein [Deltaproteobacteria bacterium]